MLETREEYRVSDDPASLDLDLIHAFLREAYWSRGIPRTVMERAVRHSLCLGLYRGAEQIGFARVVTDRATTAYLLDVFVLEPYRGRGLGKWLIGCVMGHPELQGLRRWMLASRDAGDLYSSFGFRPLAHPERFLEITAASRSSQDA